MQRHGEHLPDLVIPLSRMAQDNDKYELDEENEPGLEEILNLSDDPERWIFDLYLPVRSISNSVQ